MSKTNALTLNEYQRGALQTANPDMDEIGTALGISGEAGELAELIKKRHYQKREIAPEQIWNELGDILWYVAVAAELHGITLGEVAARNQRKLSNRYPDGFITGGGKRG